MKTAQSEQSPQTPPTPIVRRGPISVAYLREHPTVSVEQAAELLGISKAYGYDLVKVGKLGAITLGDRRFRVKSAELLRMLGED